MDIKISSTDRIVDFDGVKCRVWDGWTGGGVKCWVFVHSVAAGLHGDCAELDKELTEMTVPRCVDGAGIAGPELELVREAVARRIDEDWLRRARSVLRENGLMP